MSWCRPCRNGKGSQSATTRCLNQSQKAGRASAGIVCQSGDEKKAARRAEAWAVMARLAAVAQGWLELEAAEVVSAALSHGRPAWRRTARRSSSSVGSHPWARL